MKIRHKQDEPDHHVIAEAFSQALDIAYAFEGATSPNPAVGCVLLDKNGQVLTAEAHQRAGQGHAEARAIEASRNNGTIGQIHTAVVTLEPCNHTGRTPPCVQALLSTPVKSVWIAMRDPNPRVAGGGADALKAAGVDVHFVRDLAVPEAGHIEHRARRLIAPFVKKGLTGLLFVTVKQALDEQGSMIPPIGQKTFTAHSSLVLAHQLRRRADAIVTGSGTVLADDPEFTVRHVPDFAHKSRILAILDRRRRVSNAYIESARNRGFHVILGDDIDPVLHEIGARGAMEVLVEAGPQVTSSILATSHWDEHIVIVQGSASGVPDTISINQRENQRNIQG